MSENLIQVTTPKGKEFLVDLGLCKEDNGRAIEMKTNCIIKGAIKRKYIN